MKWDWDVNSEEQETKFLTGRSSAVGSVAHRQLGEREEVQV